MERRFLIIGSFAAIYLLWGSTYFAIALGLQSMPPFMLMGIRSLCGGLILIGLGGRDAIHASGRTWLNAGLCGLLFFVGCHGILALAQQRAPSGIAAIVLATIPFWIVLIDFLMPGDARPDPRTLITGSGLCRRHHCSVAKYQPEWRRHPPDPVAARCGAVMVGWHRIIPTDVERRLFHIHLRYAAFARRYRALSDQLVVGRDAPLLSERGLNGFP